jgi:hypothetical protein
MIFLDCASRPLVVNHFEIVAPLFPDEIKRTDETSCELFDSLVICRVLSEGMIEIDGLWWTFLLRNWRLRVDNFEISNHADQPDRVLKMEGNGALQKLGTAKNPGA